MIPYFSQDGITLYHGDCRDVLPLLGRETLPVYVLGSSPEPTAWVPGPRSSFVDCILTDPPYGIVKGSAFVRNGGDTVADDFEESFNALVPEPEWMPDAWQLLRIGGYFASFSDTRRVRETEDAIRKSHACHCDIDRAFAPRDHPCWQQTPNIWRRFYLINQAPPPTPRPTFMSGVQECVIAWKGMKREWYGGGATPNFWCGLPATRGPLSEHPAEKPLEAITLLLNALCVPGGTVLDPFAGSGTTLKAAQLTGRKAIGIEIEEARCEQIARRLSQSVRSADSQPVLF